jgi:hypothetical protein
MLITGKLTITAERVKLLGGLVQIADRPDLKLEPVSTHQPSSSCRAATLA